MPPRFVSGYRLEWLASFVAVAEYGGFSAAAKHLYRSQSRISTHVAELEQLIGTKLFDRTTQPPRLSPEGRALLPHATALLEHLDLLAEVATGTGERVHGVVRLGMYPSVAAYLLPLAMLALRKQYPGVQLVLWEGETLALSERLSRGEIDLAVRPVLPPVSDDRLVHTQLWREPLVAVLNRAHPLAGRGAVRLEQLGDQQLVTIGDSSDGAGRQFETNLAFANAGLNPRIAFQTNQPQTLISLVRHGLGVGVTNSLAMTTANTDGVVLSPIAGATQSERLVALWCRGDQPASRALHAVESVVTALPPPRFTLTNRRGPSTG
ncbi:LysR family transcriptional regulator [Amycolatopsis endophytica]|uniref:DNA-binding transcriptional LysR family regulator n=1 Tax=Amycolatopsis endophytica TaxID=860233 RepID=A0A853BAB0_9PSEU|nr:LysR family transcriptional regulator [Amycolatopsis endophytica]NYI92303.1 DNA-binding transcriptional LysR family regulator [Amycolatopsis endophytica]